MCNYEKMLLATPFCTFCIIINDKIHRIKDYSTAIKSTFLCIMLTFCTKILDGKIPGQKPA